MSAEVGAGWQVAKSKSIMDVVKEDVNSAGVKLNSGQSDTLADDWLQPPLEGTAQKE